MADVEAKIKAVEVAHAAVADKSKVIANLKQEIDAIDGYTEPVLENGVLVEKPSDTIPVQWPSGSLGGPQNHIRLPVSTWKTFLEDILAEKVAEINAIDVDAIIAAEKAKG